MDQQESERLKVFISYSWDNEPYKAWVLKLAHDLGKRWGVHVLLDRYDLKAGKDMTAFMERSLEYADKVLILLTPKYKQKALIGKGGVGFEHSIITQQLYKLQSSNEKFIPVLKEGTAEESAPGYIGSLIYHEFKGDDQYDSDLQELARLIYDEPLIERPELGPVPDFSRIAIADPIEERILNLRDEQQQVDRQFAYLNSPDGLGAAELEIANLYKSIVAQTEQYKKLSPLFFNAKFNDTSLAMWGDGGCCIFLHWTISYGNSTDGARLAVKYYSEGGIYWDSGRFYTEGYNIPVDQLDEYAVDVSPDLKTILWRNLDTDDSVSSAKLQQSFFLWIMHIVEKQKRIKNEERRRNNL